MPYYLCVSDEERLRKTNDTITKVLFLPTALALTLAFIAGNLVMVPFAYIAAVVKKIKLIAKASRKKKTLPKQQVSNGLDLAIFVLFGVPLLLFSQFIDAYYFLQQIYRDDVVEYSEESGEGGYVLTEGQFAVIEDLIRTEL